MKEWSPLLIGLVFGSAGGIAGNILYGVFGPKKKQEAERWRSLFLRRLNTMQNSIDSLRQEVAELKSRTSPSKVDIEATERAVEEFIDRFLEQSRDFLNEICS